MSLLRCSLALGFRTLSLSLSLSRLIYHFVLMVSAYICIAILLTEFRMHTFKQNIYISFGEITLRILCRLEKGSILLNALCFLSFMWEFLLHTQFFVVFSCTSLPLFHMDGFSYMSHAVLYSDK